jgi:hypothetical protein
MRISSAGVMCQAAIQTPKGWLPATQLPVRHGE